MIVSKITDYVCPSYILKLAFVNSIHFQSIQTFSLDIHSSNTSDRLAVV